MAQVRAALGAASEAAQATWGEGLGPVDVFRGDSWQLLLSRPRHALHTALLVRAFLRADCDMDTRVAIGIGPVETVDPLRVSRSTGEAFLVSGRLLDSMKRSRLALARSVASEPHFPWVEVALGLADRVVTGWTRRQAELVRLALMHPQATQAELGAALMPPQTQQIAYKVLTAAGWGELLPALEAFKAVGSGP